MGDSESVDRSEQELVAAARAGDASALEALLQRHQARVYRFSMKMCRRPEDAQDVLQDTLLAVARSLQGGEAPPRRDAASTRRRSRSSTIG